MNNCPHCGADQFSPMYRHAYQCGSLKSGHRTGACKAREPLWKELQTHKTRIESLEKAGDKLEDSVVALRRVMASVGVSGSMGLISIADWHKAKGIP
jgi:hypothetical protein